MRLESTSIVSVRGPSQMSAVSADVGLRIASFMYSNVALTSRSCPQESLGTAGTSGGPLGVREKHSGRRGSLKWDDLQLTRRCVVLCAGGRVL